MKKPLLMLAGSITFIVILIIGVFSYFPNKESSQSVIVVPVDPAVSQLESTLAEQDAVYRARATSLDASLQQQQLDFQIKLESLNDQIATAQRQLAELKREEQDLRGRIEQLENTRAEQLASFQTELRQTRNQYAARRTQLQAQLAEVQTRLTEGDTPLGR